MNHHLVALVVPHHHIGCPTRHTGGQGCAQSIGQMGLGKSVRNLEACVRRRRGWFVFAMKNDAEFGRSIRQDLDQSLFTFRSLRNYRYVVKTVRKCNEVRNQKRLRGNRMYESVISSLPVAQTYLDLFIQRRAVVRDERQAQTALILTSVVFRRLHLTNSRGGIGSRDAKP